MTKPELQRKISNILKHGNINKPENSGAKQGLEKALEILNSNQKNLSGLIGLVNRNAGLIRNRMKLKKKSNKAA